MDGIGYSRGAGRRPTTWDGERASLVSPGLAPEGDPVDLEGQVMDHHRALSGSGSNLALDFLLIRALEQHPDAELQRSRGCCRRNKAPPRNQPNATGLRTRGRRTWFKSTHGDLPPQGRHRSLQGPGDAPPPLTVRAAPPNLLHVHHARFASDVHALRSRPGSPSTSLDGTRRSWRRRWMPSAASTARRASSSCAMGAPKSAMKPSPRNWLMVPS